MNNKESKMKRKPLSFLLLFLPLLAQANPDAGLGEQQYHSHNINFNGSVDVNYSYKDYEEESKNKTGDISFNKFKLGMSGNVEKFSFSAEYRWYSYQDVIQHAWVGYQLSDNSDVKGGITQVPFGILPYADNSYWFGPLYYLGLEDDYDTGVNYSYSNGLLSANLAFFKNEEWGDSSKTERYSLDVVRSGEQQNEETNQINARAAYNIKHNDSYSTELGLSLMGGQLYNKTTNLNGDRWAVALHLYGEYDKWTTSLQATRYEYNPENPEGVSNDSVLFGGFADTYFVASKANIYTMNVAHTMSSALSYIDEVTCYSDYTIVEGGTTVDNSQLHVLGCSFGSGPLYTYVDINRAKNFVWIGGDNIGQASNDKGWNTMLNINVGYYF
jgi:hypothetical protein